jgi:hypothetical protein
MHSYSWTCRLDIGPTVGVAGWQALLVGLYVMQTHGVSFELYMGRNVSPPGQ